MNNKLIEEVLADIFQRKANGQSVPDRPNNENAPFELRQPAAEEIYRPNYQREKAKERQKMVTNRLDVEVTVQQSGTSVQPEVERMLHKLLYKEE